ncbi:MAG: DUF4410 domain-containing protein [Planctomycetota bacterium]|nr:DUF4410 domain-containing protein [Planctomycetota bacterium]
MRQVLLLGLLAVLAITSGCVGTAVSQGMSAVTGASPRVFELRDVAGPVALDRYKSVAVQAFDPAPLLGALPGDAAQETQAQTIRRLTETRMFESVGPTPGPRPALVIRGKFIDYDPGGTAARVVGLGGNPFLTAQIELIDGDTGQVLGIAMVSGTVKSAVRTGMKELADGVGKAIEGLVKQHHTKVPKEEERAAAQSGEPKEKKGFKMPWSK